MPAPVGQRVRPLQPVIHLRPTSRRGCQGALDRTDPLRVAWRSLDTPRAHASCSIETSGHDLQWVVAILTSTPTTHVGTKRNTDPNTSSDRASSLSRKSSIRLPPGRAILITSPETRGTVSVAFSMQASLFSARLASYKRERSRNDYFDKHPNAVVYLSKLDVSKAFGPEATRRVEGCHVRFGSQADIPTSPAPRPLYLSKQTSRIPRQTSAMGQKKAAPPEIDARLGHFLRERPHDARPTPQRVALADTMLTPVMLS